MPTFTFQAPQNPYIGSMSELMLAPAQARARALEIAGQANAQAALTGGQAAAQAGQQIGQAIAQPLQQEAQKLQDPRVQLEQQQVDAQKNAQAAMTKVNGIVASLTTQTPDGARVLDRSKLQQAFAAQNIPLAVQQATFKQLDDVDASIKTFQTAKIDHMADLAHGILSAPGGATPENVLLGAALAKANGLATDSDLAPIVGAAQSGQNMTPVLQQLRAMSEKYKDLSKPIVLPGAPRPGAGPSILVSPSGQTLATGAPAGPATPSRESLALDAATVGTPNETPTAKQSKIALDRLDAPATAARTTAQAAQEELARHNMALEDIAKLNQGREAAAQAETARHNRAMENLQNPLGMGAPTGGTPAQTAAPNGQPAPDASSALHPEVLQKVNPAVASTIKALAEGRMPFPSGMALRTPYWQSMISMVSQYDPSFDAGNATTRVKTRSDFTSGKSSQTINALNTVAQHLDRLSQSADALNNTWSPTYNTIANFLSKQSGSQVVTNFETDKKAVVDELTRAWRQAGGTEGDIKSWSSVLDAANSPTQLHSAIGEMGHLLEGKLSAMQAQYEQGMGLSSGGIQVIKPEAKAVLDRLEQKASGTTPATAQPAQSKTMSIAQVQQMADLAHVTYAEAKKHAESNGFTVK